MIDSRFSANNIERSDGMIPMDDIPNWVQEFQSSSDPLSSEELKSFFNWHLAKNISKYYLEGLSREECLRKIISELSTDGNKMTKRGLIFIRYAVSSAYEELRNALSKK